MLRSINIHQQNFMTQEWIILRHAQEVFLHILLTELDLSLVKLAHKAMHNTNNGVNFMKQE